MEMTEFQYNIPADIIHWPDIIQHQLLSILAISISQVNIIFLYNLGILLYILVKQIS